MSTAAVYYRIERTYLSRVDGQMAREVDPRPHLVGASSAEEAARAFVFAETGELLGEASLLQGDKAIAAAMDGTRVYVVFVQRAAESIRSAGDDRDRRPARS